ncbi:MAG: hypothetical protein AMXMBFR64_31160 [Myxococcales bacterium]
MTPRTVTLTVGAAPHWRTRNSVARLHLAMILALAPAALLGAVGHAFGPKAAALDGAFGPLNAIIRELTIAMGVDSAVLWLFGILGTVALAMGVAVLVEYGCQVAMRQRYHAMDGHGALMGMLLALMMPPTVPWWVLIIGVAAAIFIGKQLYGGLGGYPMHPAVVGWLVLLLSFPNHVYPVGAASIAAPSELAVLATAVGGLALWWLGHIRLEIPTGVLVAVVLFSLLFGSKLHGGVIDQLMTGHVMLAAFFLATDTTSSPSNRVPMLLFGFGVGTMIMLIRAFGIWPDAAPFAVMLMNAIFPLLDRIRPQRKTLVPREVSP